MVDWASKMQLGKQIAVDITVEITVEIAEESDRLQESRGEFGTLASIF
jgi:hypothetical protein